MFGSRRSRLMSSRRFLSAVLRDGSSGPRSVSASNRDKFGFNAITLVGSVNDSEEWHRVCHAPCCVGLESPWHERFAEVIP